MVTIKHCPASQGYCEYEYSCQHCQKVTACLHQTQRKHQTKSGNGSCFQCQHLRPVTMGVECGIKKAR